MLENKEVDLEEDKIAKDLQGLNRAQNHTVSSCKLTPPHYTNKLATCKSNATNITTNISDKESYLELQRPVANGNHGLIDEFTGGKLANYNRSSEVIDDFNIVPHRFDASSNQANSKVHNCDSNQQNFDHHPQDPRTLREHFENSEKPSSVVMNNSTKLIYNKCSDGENKNSKNNNVLGDGVEGNVNNMMQECSSSSAVDRIRGVMNNNTNNSDVLSFPSHGKTDDVGVTFCNTSSTIGFHNAFDKESSSVYVNDKYISEISKSNILGHEDNHYHSQPPTSHHLHQPDHYLHQPSNRSSGARYGEQFINGYNKNRRLLVEDDENMVHDLKKRYVNDKSEERRVTKDTGNDELNINECSTLPTYSSFKSAIFPQLRPKRPQGNLWSDENHPSHVITHGTTDDFEDAMACADEYHTEFSRRNLSTFSPTNITKVKNSNNSTHENDFVSLAASESEPHVLDYCIQQKRPQLFTRSIDRRAILRNHQMLGYPSDARLPKRLRNNGINHYSPNGEMFNRSFDDVQYNTSSTPSCEATLSRSYLASRSRGYQSGQPFSMKLALEHSPNHPSVFRNKRSREETWLV